MNELHRDIKHVNICLSLTNPGVSSRACKMYKNSLQSLLFLIAHLKLHYGRNRKPLTSCRSSQTVVKFFNDALLDGSYDII